MSIAFKLIYTKFQIQKLKHKTTNKISFKRFWLDSFNMQLHQSSNLWTSYISICFSLVLKAYRRTLGLKMEKSTRRLKLTLNLNLNHVLIFRPILTGWLWQFLSHLLLSKNIEKAIFEMLWLLECDELY